MKYALFVIPLLKASSGCPRTEAYLFESIIIEGAGIDLGLIAAQESDLKILVSSRVSIVFLIL